jgi:hypothetical protein
MNKSYVELWYRKGHGAAKCAVVAVPVEHRRLISDTAELARKKLEEAVGSPIVMINYSYLGAHVTIVE